MVELNEIRLTVNNSGLATVANTYAKTYMYANGRIEKVILDVTTGSGIANNGSMWVGISGDEVILSATALTGTTTKVFYPRRYINNVSGAQLGATSGGNVLEPFIATPNRPFYVGGSGWGSGTSLSVGADISVFWHKY